jgi:hypothetical protein
MRMHLPCILIAVLFYAVSLSLVSFVGYSLLVVSRCIALSIFRSQLLFCSRCSSCDPPSSDSKLGCVVEGEPQRSALLLPRQFIFGVRLSTLL